MKDIVIVLHNAVEAVSNTCIAVVFVMQLGVLVVVCGLQVVSDLEVFQNRLVTNISVSLHTHHDAFMVFNFFILLVCDGLLNTVNGAIVSLDVAWTQSTKVVLHKLLSFVGAAIVAVIK